ncbi:beta-galactosidase [Saccharothrix saharensis]|uniref:beta-galactosidase n=1 Tax=Saccharothrix saharensis TaxID=571190 RepID=UPI003682E64E
MIAGRTTTARIGGLAVVAVLAAMYPVVPAHADPPDPRPSTASHTVTYDKHSFMVDGKRLYLWSGEFHYWRLPSPDLWRDVLQKMKAAGFNATSVYFHWGFHSPARGVYDFTGVRDVDRLLDIAEEVGIYVLARPGPYINAETDSGGLPNWLITSPARDRSNDADYIAAVDEWLDRINPIIARHQLTDGGGTVILYQTENEFGDQSDSGVAYMTHLQQRARADGITVPTFHNTAGTGAVWVPGTPGAPDLYAFDLYPQGFNCADPATWSPLPDLAPVREHSRNGPIFTAEFQGGSFDYWGGNGWDKCRELTGPAFQRVFYGHNIASGVSAQNFYMTYGGTSWGWLPSPGQVYTSYDYGAAISEDRRLTDKYAVQKELGYFLQAVTPITKTDPAPDVPASDPAVTVTQRRNPDTGTRFLVVRHTDVTSTAHTSFTVPIGDDPAVPMTLPGRDSKLLVVDYDLERQRLAYSTSEIMTHLRSGDRDIAVLHGRKGTEGRTVLEYASEPKVTVLSGRARSSWDGRVGRLRLDYAHDGLVEVLVSGGGRPDLLVLLGDDEQFDRLWTQSTDAGRVLVLGPALLRTASTGRGALALTGDTAETTSARVWAPTGTRRVTWNGHPTTPVRDRAGALTFALRGPVEPSLPELTGWRRSAPDPSSAVDFDDSHWTIANKTTTHNPSPPGVGQPVLHADEYGYHHGDIWYRGHFTADGGETGINLGAVTGNAGVWSVWVNGRFVGSVDRGGTAGFFDLPRDLLKPGADNVVAVLVRNMGHNQTYGNNAHKELRGLTSARLRGSTAPITWRLHGNTGGETGLDPVRGAYNNGGLHGENAGWSLPGFPDRDWDRTTLPATQEPGVTWYRTTADLDLPAGQDTPVSLVIEDDPSRHYRAQLFVNGWNVGQYVNHVGPQTAFPVPTGILNPNGRNTIAIASWAADGTGGLGKVSLRATGTVAGGAPTHQVRAPSYDRRTYAQPVGTAQVTVTAPASTRPGTTFTVKADYTPTANARDVRLRLGTSTGWTAAEPLEVSLGDVAAGRTATASWQVTAPADGEPRVGVFTATAEAAQRGRTTTAGGAGTTLIPVPPPTGTAYVSDIPFTATNGWGPVERDTSNGENGSGDGRPITLNGVVHAKGLGTHAGGEVQVFLGGNCSRLTAVVGVDDEVGSYGTVRFTIAGDGVPLAETGTLTGDDPGRPLTADLTGVQWLSLVTGDAGDGNGSDHADWADAVLTCTD